MPPPASANRCSSFIILSNRKPIAKNLPRRVGVALKLAVNRYAIGSQFAYVARWSRRATVGYHVERSATSRPALSQEVQQLL